MPRAKAKSFGREAIAPPPDAEHCAVHPETTLVVVKYCPKCQGAKGGRVSSPAKIAASRANAKLGGKLGGRPAKWEATIVNARDQVRTVVVTGRNRQFARLAAAAHAAASDVITKLARVTRKRAASSRQSRHSPECDTETTGRYTADCPACLEAARAVTAAQHQAEIIRKKGRA